MNNGEIRRFLRDMLEVEVEDWPDALIDASVKEAYSRIVGREQRWPFYQERWTLALTEGQGSYPLSALGDVRDVTSVRLGRESLSFTDEALAEERYDDSTGTPVEFSRWGDSITFWPTPAVADVVQIRGYRQPLAWQPDAGWSPDLPDEFHALLCDWALANEYQRQDDPEMMVAYRNKFEDQLAALRKQFTATPTPTPLVVGRQGRGHGRRVHPTPAEWR